MRLRQERFFDRKRSCRISFERENGMLSDPQPDFHKGHQKESCSRENGMLSDPQPDFHKGHQKESCSIDYLFIPRMRTELFSRSWIQTILDRQNGSDEDRLRFAFRID
ncbi:unnamed protein product [Anisakis simplex]|uniref:Uncharacterized protein n=1 Tax=Anisakis simplex TaxID=6269 RepID=A0A0M3KDJ1_ANISI|nr:unnamed protein product [Anisakis simplex]